MKSFAFGKTALNLPIIAYEFGLKTDPPVLILGGVHGDEHEGVMAAQNLLGAFLKLFDYKLFVTLIPIFNLDGLLKKQRKNARDVDLNRNLPTQDWSPEWTKEKYFPGKEANSEPENQALVNWIKKNSPLFILTWHSWFPLLNTNGDCEPEAKEISKQTGYKVTDHIGYPTPGSLGTYSGMERKIPTLTYELERNLSPEKIVKIHVPAVLKALKMTEKRFSVSKESALK